MKHIKTLISIGAVAVACAFGTQCLAQPGPAQPGAAPIRPVSSPTADVRFDLSFPGGTPASLINAIEKASQQHVNAVIPDQYASIQLPPLKMQAVTVSELFNALQQASRKTVKYVTGTYFGGLGQ